MRHLQEIDHHILASGPDPRLEDLPAEELPDGWTLLELREHLGRCGACAAALEEAGRFFGELRVPEPEVAAAGPASCSPRPVPRAGRRAGARAGLGLALAAALGFFLASSVPAVRAPGRSGRARGQSAAQALAERLGVTLDEALEDDDSARCDLDCTALSGLYDLRSAELGRLLDGLERMRKL